MKILQVLNNFLPQQTAGTEVYVWALSKELQGLNNIVEIIIPNFNKKFDEQYFYDDIKVTKYSENSVVDRNLIMGFKKPEGLINFVEYLKNYKPDVVHFHELAGSNGITIYHVQAAKEFGSKIVFTFHLAGYTCKTGTLVYKGQELCNGIIDIKKCSDCYLHTKNSSLANFPIKALSHFFYFFNVNTTTWNNRLGTALGTAFVIKKLKDNFNLLINASNEIVVLTNWYKQILINSNVPINKINYLPQGLANNKTILTNKKNEVSFPIKLVFVGRISSFKGLHLLIDAMLSLPSNKICLDIYGQNDGTDYELNLKLKSSKSNNILWKGLLLPDQVIVTMQQYHLLCLCSTFSEMSPLVIQEAFAAGIPVLASNVYGNVEQIMKNNAGFIFKFNDSIDLKLKLEQIIENPSLIVKAQENILPTSKFDLIAKEQLRIYQKN